MLKKCARFIVTFCRPVFRRHFDRTGTRGTGQFARDFFIFSFFFVAIVARKTLSRYSRRIVIIL